MHHHHPPRDSATSNVLAWSSHSASNTAPTEEEVADADEPPDPRPPMTTDLNMFKRNPVAGRGCEPHESLLTKALSSPSEEEAHDRTHSLARQRRRSITSNISLASTMDLNYDTDVTTPARTSSPSPRLPDSSLVHLPRGTPSILPQLGEATVPPKSSAPAPPPAKENENPAVQEPVKKRCISFACAARPRQNPDPPMPPPRQDGGATSNTNAQDAPLKRPAIKFACPARPPTNEPVEPVSRTPAPKAVLKPDSPVARKNRSSSAVRSARSTTPRRSYESPAAVRRRRYLAADSKDLQSECSKFHEFASDELQEDDWISRDDNMSRGRITIDDTLQKENAIRKLAKEAEEEAELDDSDADVGQDGDDGEEEGEQDDEDDDDDETASLNDAVGLEDDDEQDEDEDEDEDDSSGYGSDDSVSDGYKTDNEVGFADSDDEDDDADGLVFWTTGRVGRLSISGSAPAGRPSSLGDGSDSSVRPRTKRQNIRARRSIPYPDQNELPDSTDFVCGTLDEDRPLEEAYISSIAARKREEEELHPIPQDIDPSFPTSEPEDEGEGGYENSHPGNPGNDDHLWLHGELEDLHHETSDRGDKRKKTAPSPKRYHSPPPKRLHSPPAPKGRGRSPSRLFDKQHSPRRCKSPPPQGIGKSPRASPLQGGQKIAFKSLVARPGLEYTKSLPKPPALFPHLKKRGRAGTLVKDNHVRGAIDIVKGLEKKRQRRKEKFFLKYCTRARKNQAQVKRPPPGQGAQRMREVGLIMAGKIGPGNYVISI